MCKKLTPQLSKGQIPRGAGYLQILLKAISFRIRPGRGGGGGGGGEGAGRKGVCCNWCLETPTERIKKGTMLSGKR